MARNRQSAKQAGARFARIIADGFKDNGFKFADKKPQYGAKDRGDVGGVHTLSGDAVTIECKDYGGQFLVGEWLKEVEKERVNDRGVAGVVIAKRRGKTDPLDQVCFMEMRDLLALLTGTRPS
jgi:hypothetical protein